MILRFEKSRNEYVEIEGTYSGITIRWADGTWNECHLNRRESVTLLSAIEAMLDQPKPTEDRR